MSNLLNKFITSKRDVPPAMSQWMRHRTKKGSLPEDVSSEERSVEIVITKVKNDGKRKANATESDDDDEEVQINKVEQERIKKRKVPDEVRIVRVTPPLKE